MNTTTPRTSGLAIAGLICGILGFVTAGLTGLIGLGLSLAAMGSIKRSQGQVGGSGVALGGLITSSTSILLGCLFAALLGLLLPALGQARFQAQRLVEMSNVGTVGIEFDLYTLEHDGLLPGADDWDVVIGDRLGDDTMLRSTRDRAAGRAFAMNAALGGVEKDAVADPEATVLLFECDPGAPPSGGRELLPIEPRYRDGYLILFLDGTISEVAPQEIDALVWESIEFLP